MATFCVLLPLQNVKLTAPAKLLQKSAFMMFFHHPQSPCTFYTFLSSSFVYQCKSGETPFTVKWHPTLQQLVVGMHDGSIHCLYDEDMSKKGAVMVAGRKVGLCMSCDV
jgi:hypothetical protein